MWHRSVVVFPGASLARTVNVVVPLVTPPWPLNAVDDGDTACAPLIDSAPAGC
jgi:hypothetical protein